MKKYLIVLGIGMLYLLFVLGTGIGLPCVFYLLTGWQCPSCGVSRMFLAVTRLDFAAAFHYNSFLFVTSPVILFCIVAPDVCYVRTGRCSLGRASVLLWIEIALAVAFGVFRNLQ
ncbi:MAG: DUF2752 domain-containing protein [Clostridia bacterium]|nr:DUF2752 domain-containing protein [Clostridia bacterium]